MENVPSAGGAQLQGEMEMRGYEFIEDKNARRKHGQMARYKKGRFLGKGGFAKCYEVQDVDTKEVFAAKIVAKASISKPRAHAKLKSEIAIHSSLDHSTVVKFYDYFEDSDHVYIILELCPNQTLNEFMRRRPNKRLSEPEAMFYIYDLIVGLQYLHHRRVIHRDLKLGNLFLDAHVRLKMGDFGLAAQLDHDGEKKRTICGTPNYIAPEILEGKHGHSYEVDIWSLGVILYTMLIGRPPFETSDVKTTYRRIRYNQYTFSETVPISDHAKDLISSILRTDPRSRPTPDEVLTSPWFRSCRLPPPVPHSVASFAGCTPRSAGGCSARSETPERGGVNFARIDSPAPRFPLRDRSPDQTPVHNAQQAQNCGVQPNSGRGSASSVPNSVKASPQPYGSGFVNRYPSGSLKSSRPPLVHRGNEENVAPHNAYGGGGDTAANVGGTASPAASRAVLGAPVPGFRAHGSHAHLTPSGSAGRLSPATGSNPKQTQMPRREGSPLISTSGTAGSTQTPGKMLGMNYMSSRSRTSSPRQTALLASARLAPSASTPKENRPLHVLGPQSDSGYGGLHKQATPGAVLRSAAPSTLSARKLAVPENLLSLTPASSAHHLPNAGHTQQRYPSQAVASGIVSGESATAQPPTPSVTADATDRKAAHTPAPLSERNSSSPAMVFDAPHRGESATPSATTSSQPDGCGSTRLLGVSQRGSGTPSHAQKGPYPLVRPPSSTKLQSPTVQAGGVTMPELWVVKWVDYSSKYGVGYILSDRSIGVYFNDSTKIVLAPDCSRFDYFTRRTTERNEVVSTHTFDNFPEDLKKKVTLLRHFKSYMSTDALDKKDGATMGESSLPQPSKGSTATYEPGQAPYVRKWTRNKHAIMFQLSNRVVQVVFFDNTEAVLSSRCHMVTYVDKARQAVSYPISEVLDGPNPELSKRLRFTKSMLENFLGVRNVDHIVPTH
mmetsp:Transcript_120942/g.342121  ORF Transcript_120942/g.342121 Transcript_120942/m.342121 type:complete len:951 (-) Transcript_120942:202-3054(-)